MARILKLGFVTFGFLGLAPVAPGTFGTLGGVLLAWLFVQAGWSFPVAVLVACTLLYAIGRSLGEWAEAYAGGKDPGFFVVDEVIGYLVTILWVRPPSLTALVVAFLVFRFFDIAKPPPVKRFEAIGGGDGILLDDVVAGVYGLLVMTLLRFFVLEPGAWVHAV